MVKTMNTVHDFSYQQAKYSIVKNCYLQQYCQDQYKIISRFDFWRALRPWISSKMVYVTKWTSFISVDLSRARHTSGNKVNLRQFPKENICLSRNGKDMHTSAGSAASALKQVSQQTWTIPAGIPLGVVRWNVSLQILLDLSQSR